MLENYANTHLTLCLCPSFSPFSLPWFYLHAVTDHLLCWKKVEWNDQDHRHWSVTLGFKPHFTSHQFLSLRQVFVSPCVWSLKNTLLASFIKGRQWFLSLWTSFLNTEQETLILVQGWGNGTGCQQHSRLLLIWCKCAVLSMRTIRGQTEKGHMVSLLSIAND